MVTLTASAAAGSNFVGWSGACTGSGACVVLMDSPRNVTANFDLRRFSLAVTRLGAASGTVTSMPAGISCGATCAADYPIGTRVTLTAAPGASAIFGSWGGTARARIDARVHRDHRPGQERHRALRPPAYTITVLANGAGTGTVASTPAGIDCGLNCSASFATQTRVTLNATPSYGSTFVGWGNDCAGVGRACWWRTRPRRHRQLRAR